MVLCKAPATVIAAVYAQGAKKGRGGKFEKQQTPHFIAFERKAVAQPIIKLAWTHLLQVPS
jgi:hypothetical protein